MNFEQIARTIAPTIATGLLGPLGGVVANIVGGFLFPASDASKVTTQDVISKITSLSDPADFAKLKDAELAVRKFEADNGFRFAQLEAESQQNARTMRVASLAAGNKTADAIAWWTLASFLVVAALVLAVVVLALLKVLDVDNNNASVWAAASGLLGSVLGYFSANANQVVSFYFGSSAGSAAKTDQLAQHTTEVIAELGRTSREQPAQAPSGGPVVRLQQTSAGTTATVATSEPETGRLASGPAVASPSSAPAPAALDVPASSSGAVPPAADASTGRAEIAAAMREAAGRLGTDVEVLASIAFVESHFRTDAHNPRSTAFGLFQFLDGTWRDLVGQEGAALGVAVGDRRDLRAQCLMGAALLRDNSRTLQRSLGRKPEPAECYAAHFFGAETAARLLQGGDDVQADAALGDAAQRTIAANKPIFVDGDRTRTVGQVMQVFQTKMTEGLVQARELLAGGAAAPVAAAPAAAPAEGPEPPWLALAQREIGQKEAPGPEDNPRIVEYFGATTFGPHPDDVSWCGAFVSFCLSEARIIDKGSARAADWLDFGEALPHARAGCIAVLKPQGRGSSGHVGFWVGQDGGRLRLLAGNQHDRVDVTSYPLSAMAEGGLRWPRGVA